MTDMFENRSLWERLRDADKPIFMYGTGNGGDKIISALDMYGVKLTGVFASDEFVRDRYFNNMKVRAYSDVISEYGENIIVLLAFGTTLPDVKEFIMSLDTRHELYIPDVPLYGGDLFDFDYFLAHKCELETVRMMLSDEKSKLIFDDAVNFRLTGKAKYLSRTDDVTDTLRELFACRKIGTVIDGGAYRGDSVENIISALSPHTVLAIEPDPKTFAKLLQYSSNQQNAEVIPLNCMLYDRACEIEFVSSGSRGSGKTGANKRAHGTTVTASTIDIIADGREIDFIKLDVEGAEREAIAGARETIRRCSPNMSVSLYHRTDDIFELIELIHSVLPNHRLYLRRCDCIPMWDLNLYAVK